MAKPKNIEIWLYENERYAIAVDGEIKYECLADDEVVEIVKELMEDNAE